MIKDKIKGGSMTTQLIAQGAIIAALYVVLTLVFYWASFKEIQCRVAEALCMTIYFTPAGVWGVFVGCFISNMFSGSWLDMVFGSLATLIAVLLTKPIVRAIKKKCGDNLDFKHSLLIPIPTVVVNAVIIPFVLYYGYGVDSIWSATSRNAVLGIMAFTVAAGEIISCYVFGPLFVKIMKETEKSISG